MHGNEEIEGQNGEGTFHGDLVDQGVHMAAHLATGRPDQAFAQLARMLQEQGKLPDGVDPVRLAQSVMGMVSRGDVVPPPVNSHPGHAANGEPRPTAPPSGAVRRTARNPGPAAPPAEAPENNAAQLLNQVGLRIAEVIENDFVRRFGVRENGFQIQIEITYKSGLVAPNARGSDTDGPAFTAEAFLLDREGEERELNDPEEVLTAGADHLGDLVNMLLQEAYTEIERIAEEEGGEPEPEPAPAPVSGVTRARR